MSETTKNHNGYAADVCRERGWDVGTRLIGDEGYGPTVIEITAIGERKVIAKTLGHNGEARYPHEASWVLYCRDWREASDDEVPQPISTGTRVGFVHDGIEFGGVVTAGPDWYGAYQVTDDQERCWLIKPSALTRWPVEDQKP